ncbi:MAG: IS5 family transposase [Gemmatimonadaceae bacterium]|nr:IS5 family transposase [Gemmatimonadaceae bacterium]
MTEQRTYADVILSNKRRTTRREQFLTERDRVIPRATVEALVALHYPKAGRGRRPLPMRTLLRIHFLQRWFNQSDPQAADMLHDSESTRRFARIDLLSDTVPDETTICRFRHLPEAHQRTARMFDAVKALLEERKPMLKAGTIVDATIIGAPSATKNARQTRDPEMRQTKKGNPWYFGMKMHVGTDRRGLIHSITTTHAAAADITQLPHLLDGQETTLHGDRAYDKADDNDVGAQRRALPRQQERQATEYWDWINRARSRVRAMVEHPFHTIKRLWGFTKVRYRGLAKNTVRVFALGMLANLYRVRHRWVPQGT